MHIKHHGAVNGVTGSCHELQFTSGKGVLIDCGLFQGDERGSEHRHASDTLKQGIDFDISHIQALVVTHVHIDHVGRIPYLLAAGFDNPIYCSEASALLLPLVIEDALKVGFTRNSRLIKHVMQKLLSLITPLPYKQWQSVKGADEELLIRLQPAGHILGSAYVQCRLLGDKAANKLSGKHYCDIIFSGDLGAPYTPLLPAPKSPYSADIVVIESTYGDTLHHNRKTRRQQLQARIEKAVQDNGIVLIPAFSIGRTQELLYELEAIIQRQTNSLWQDLEFIIDSPLAAEFTQSYRQLAAHWDKEARSVLKQGRHPLNFEQLYTVNSHEEHLQTIDYLKQRRKPAIVIAASGMCAGGRIVNYLKAFIEDNRSDILLAGYQAHGTPGRSLQKYAHRNGYVELDGKRYSINASVSTLSGYSAHADQKDLINFIKRMRKKPAEVRIVHGDDMAKTALKKQLQHLLPHSAILIPTA